MTQKLKFILGRIENIVGKGENAGYQHFLLFPQSFQKVSYAGLGKELTLSQTTNFRVLQTKGFADNNFKFDENGRKFTKRSENTVGKGGNAHYEQFLLFPQFFQRTCATDRLKPGLVLEQQWRETICKKSCFDSFSHCTQHGWKRRKFNPRKKSVFSIDQQQTSDQNDQQDQAAGDDLDDITNFIMRGNSFYSERDSPNKASLMCPQKDQVGDQKPDSEDEKEGSASSVSMASSVVEATSPDITDGNKELLVEDNDDGGNVEECEDIQDEDNNDLESTSDNLEDDMDFIDAGDADDEEIEGDRPLGMDSGQLVEPDMGSKIGKSGKLVDFDNRGIYLRDLLTNGEANQSTPVCNDGIESPDAVDNCSICQDQIAVDKCDDKLTENIRKDTPSIHRETDTNCYKDRNDSKTKDVFQEVVQGIVKNNSTEDLESINRNQNALRKSEKNHQEQLGSSPTISSRLSPESSISYASIASFVAERKGAQSTESEDNLAGSMSSLSVQDESKGAC